ncbi:MAG: NAD(P)H-dependent oxidoreductase [Saccharofermentans sp.]|nr:NAD(P)H-dependent oxidoreductase [Saccharofermentans sp.]
MDTKHRILDEALTLFSQKGYANVYVGEIADKIEGENEITEFFFPKDLNHFCSGCYQCIENVTACPFHEEKKIIDAIDKADILIVTTPTYCMHMSAPLKSLQCILREVLLLQVSWE